MGWNSSISADRAACLHASRRSQYVYFVHSYYLRAEEDVVTATAEYGVTIDAAVQKSNLLACQFHPRKEWGGRHRAAAEFAAMAGEGGQRLMYAKRIIPCLDLKKRPGRQGDEFRQPA